MTEAEKSKILWGRRFVALGFYAVGSILAGIAIAMVWFFGETLGITETERNLYGGAHAAIHVFGILVALSIGMFVIDKSKSYAVLAIIMVMIVGGFGMSNITGFAARNRISVADATSENADRDLKQWQTTRADYERRRDWHEGQSMSFDNSKAERANFKRQASEYDRKLAALKMPTVTANTVHADAQANTWGTALGWTERAVQLTTIGWLAFLMFSGEVLSFVFGVRIWGSAIAAAGDERAAGEPPKTQSGSGGSSGSGGGEPRGKLKVVQGEPAEPKPIRAEPSKQQRSVFYVPSTGAPERNLSAFDRAYEVATQHPYLSTRAIAARAGVSQSTGHRVKQRALTKVDRIVRKYGNGEGFRPLAYN